MNKNSIQCVKKTENKNSQILDIQAFTSLVPVTGHGDGSSVLTND